MPTPIAVMGNPSLPKFATTTCSSEVPDHKESKMLLQDVVLIQVANVLELFQKLTTCIQEGIQNHTHQALGVTRIPSIKVRFHDFLQPLSLNVGRNNTATTALPINS